MRIIFKKKIMSNAYSHVSIQPKQAWRLVPSSNPALAGPFLHSELPSLF